MTLCKQSTWQLCFVCAPVHMHAWLAIAMGMYVHALPNDVLI